MSLLELISQRSTCEASVFSLPDLLVEQAFVRLKADGEDAPELDIGKLNTIIAELLAHELLRDGTHDALRYADLLFQHGLSEQRFLGQVLPAAADALGRAWEEDRLTFADVTHASGQLMEVARAAMAPPTLETMNQAVRPRALLARTPGEDHYIGLILTAQELRRRGWLVRVELTGSQDALKAAYASDSFDVVGFAVSGKGVLPQLSEAAKQARRLNKNGCIVAGGWLADQTPGAVESAGADFAIGRKTGAIEHLMQHVAIGDV